MTDVARTNLDWAWAALDALVAAGVRHAVVSPGSRSTPLALAANRHPGLDVTVVLDERAAAFHALGLAKGARAPVVLVCTSGTAGANWHPALAEAAASGVPLIALTADRPPRLRGLGAPQTIDQVRLFGPTTGYAELALPVADPAGRRAMAMRVALAAAEALAAPAGPVHLNVPFDEPLAMGREALAAWTPPADAAPRVWPARGAVAPDALAAIAARLGAARRPVLVAGPGAGADDAGPALLAWAAAAGMPVVADVGAELRGLAVPGALVATHADLYLRAPAVAAFAPDLVVLAGGVPTSKAVMTFAAGCGAPAVALWPDGLGRDPAAVADVVATGDVAEAAGRLAALATGAADPAWAELWRAAEARAAAAIAAGEGEAPGDPAIPREAQAVRAAVATLPAGALLALSNSLPIRHADAYMGAGPAGVRPIVFRGANGIDGVTAAALGAARGAGAPTLLVTGDLAFLHDLGGLALARFAATPVAILVLDNDGGGIFHHLPIAEAAPDFETLFGTPQGRELPCAAALFDVPCTVADDPADAGAAVAEALARPGVAVVVFRSERTETAASHKAFAAHLSTLPPLPSGERSDPQGPGEGNRPAPGVPHLPSPGAEAHDHPSPDSAPHRGEGAPAGVPWNITTWGDPGAPPLLLLHGFAADARAWAPLAERLAARGWHVLAADLPGHGGTPAPAHGDDLATAAADLGATLDALGAARPTVVGYSLGGRLALHLALARPLEGLVLVGASPGLADPADRAARVAADAAWIAKLEAGLPAFQAAWDGQDLFAGRRALPPEARAHADAARADQDPAGLAAAMRAFGLGAQAPLHDRLAALDLPVVLVAGERDAKFRGLAAGMAAALPHATVVIAPDAGHDVPLERPDTLLEAVDRLASPKGALR